MIGPSTVLLVEDNAKLRALLRTELTGPHRVRVAAGGEEAWRQIRANPPDLLLCDANLPGLNGKMLCRQVKGTDRLPSIPVLLLGDVPRNDRVPPSETPDEVLGKPFSPDELRRHVERYLPAREFPALPDTGGAFLKKAVRAIERQLHDPDFTVADLADTMDLSRRPLTRRLKEEADTTPAALIRARRIERAESQLEENPKTVREVGQMMGFRSASHFSQVFRARGGGPPSTYRDRQA
jgi:CheY-like chemotaxis protein